ncbi:MAG TPA: hypothetical protein VEA41_20775 [Salinarimonas sp.]|nr:hypothetical protein [Salinarimonas sp.]
MTHWTKGLPPGSYYDGMTEDYEATLTVAGGWWHRRRTPEERAAYINAKASRAGGDKEQTR